MKLSKIINIYDAIDKVLTKSDCVELNFKLIENQELISCYKDRIEKAMGDNKEYGEFEQQRSNLCIKYSTKDENNQPIIINNFYQGLDTNMEFIEKTQELQKKYKDIIISMNKKMDERNKLLDSEIEESINFIKINKKLISDGLMDGITLKTLLPIISMDSNENK